MAGFPLSFEFYPPKTDEQRAQLLAIADEDVRRLDRLVTALTTLWSRCAISHAVA